MLPGLYVEVAQTRPKSDWLRGCAPRSTYADEERSDSKVWVRYFGVTGCRPAVARPQEWVLELENKPEFINWVYPVSSFTVLLLTTW